MFSLHSLRGAAHKACTVLAAVALAAAVSPTALAQSSFSSSSPGGRLTTPANPNDGSFQFPDFPSFPDNPRRTNPPSGNNGTWNNQERSNYQERNVNGVRTCTYEYSVSETINGQLTKSHREKITRHGSDCDLEWPGRPAERPKNQPSTPTPPVTKQVKLTQGDRVILQRPDGKTSACTLSYVGANSVAVIAAHCGQPGTVVYTKQGGYKLGTMRSATAQLFDYSTSFISNPDTDVAYVDLEPSVYSGGNIYSGDKIVRDIRAARPGSEACWYGSSTLGVRCGTLVTPQSAGISGTRALVIRNAEAIPGDSGGPIWIKGLGYIGVLSASAYSDDSVTQTIGVMLP